MRHRGIEVILVMGIKFFFRRDTRACTQKNLPRSSRESSDSWLSGLVEEESSTSSLITLASFLQPFKPNLRAMIHFILRTISLDVIPSFQCFLMHPCSSQSISDDALSLRTFKLFTE
jgi:hypothetical protein